MPSTATRLQPMTARALVLALAAAAAACASAPPPASPVVPPPKAVVKIVPIDTRVGWIVRLEDARLLRDPDVAPSTAEEPGVFRPAAGADLLQLITDVDPIVRRRTAIALGRVGLKEGVAPLVSALADPETDVKEAAAFGLGLLASKDAVTPLTATLHDASPIVRGRAAEALGLIGDAGAAAAIADMAADCGATLAGVQPDDETWPMAPEIEACRLALFSLVRLKQPDALVRVALDAQGQAVSRWWPVAYALQRAGDSRVAPALLTLASTAGVYTPAFALTGLGRLKDVRAAPLARALAGRAGADVRLRVAAVRMLAQIKDVAAIEGLAALSADRATPPNLAIEAVAALGTIGGGNAFDPLADLFVHKAPAIRSAALAAAARVDPEAFLLVVSSLGRDKEWSVRAGLASVLAALPADRVRGLIEELAGDDDPRVAAAGLVALAKIGSPMLTERLRAAISAPDFALRAAAAGVIGTTHPADGVAQLTEAYARGKSDVNEAARVAALEALARLGGDAAKSVLHEALADADWPVRERAADLLRGLGEAGAEPVRPASQRQPPEFFTSAALLHPAYSPHAFIETRYGTVEFELDVVDAPLTSMSFVELARKGFFNGMRIHRVVANFVMQAGDTRGDGEGGPGYDLRDELSTTPFLRGTVGMALSTRDTGGSQFFITVSPQPHLDGKYAVFGRVVKGFDVLDQLSQWDVIDRVRIWDGLTFK